VRPPCQTPLRPGTPLRLRQELSSGLTPRHGAGFFSKRPRGSPAHRSTSPLWISVFILSVKCSTLACKMNAGMLAAIRGPSGPFIRTQVPPASTQQLRGAWPRSSKSCPTPEPSLSWFSFLFYSNNAARKQPPCPAHLQVVDGEGIFVDVSRVGAHRDAGDGRQVPAVAPHRLHDEDAALGARGRLLDAVAALRREKVCGCVWGWSHQENPSLLPGTRCWFIPTCHPETWRSGTAP